MRLQVIFLFVLLATQLTYHVSYGSGKEEFEEGMKKVYKQIGENNADPRETESLAKLVTENANKVTQALEKIETKEVEKKENKGEAGLDFSASNVKFAVGLAVGSLPTLIDGIQKKDWRNVLKGSLGIATSFLYFTGPWGPVIAAFLPLLDSIFKLMDGSVPQTEESQEHMVDRVVTAAIERAHLKEFKMELAGVQRVYSTLSQSIASFRSGRRELSKEQASILYNLAFEEISPIGKLADLIKQKCSLPYDFNPEGPSTPIDDCLTFVDLYSDISILRKLVLVDMASLLTGKFDETADNLMDMYRREFRTDIELLHFIVNPVDYPASRFITATFYQQRHLHEVTAFFLDILVNAYPHKGAKGVLVCAQEALYGFCYEMGEGAHEKDGQTRKPNDMGGYSKRIMSMFIPPKLKVTANFETDDRGIEKAGPFYGMTVLVSPFKKFYGKLPKEKWETLTIEKTDQDALNMVKICLTEGAGIFGVCISVEDGEHDLSKYLGSYIMGSFGSMIIPDNRKVTLFNNDNIAIGPFYGPDSIESLKVPQKDYVKGNNDPLTSWSKIKVEVSIPNENARHMVMVCTEFFFKGRCFRTKLGDHTNIGWTSPYRSIFTQKYNGFIKEFKIASMIIPSNIRVTLYSQVDFQGLASGPFTGPVQMTYVHYGNSLKIKDVSSEMPSEKLPESNQKRNQERDGSNRNTIDDNTDIALSDPTIAKKEPADVRLSHVNHFANNTENLANLENEILSNDNDTLENATETASLTKINRQLGNELQDETQLKEFIKDGRQNIMEDSHYKHNSLMIRSSIDVNINSRRNKTKRTTLGKKTIYFAKPIKSMNGERKDPTGSKHDVFHADGVESLKRRNNIKHRKMN